MSVKSIRVALFLVVATSLFWGLSAMKAQASRPSDNIDTPVSGAILYHQPPSPAGGIFQSSLLEPNGSAFDEWVWDDFTLGSTQAIAEVQWRGGYKLGSGGPVIGFTLKFYPTNPTGLQPDVNNPLVSYTLNDNAGETPAEVLGGVQTYDYHYVLPVPFQAASGTKYWVQIEGVQQGGAGFSPDWGLSLGLGGDGRHFRRCCNGGLYQTITGDTAFTLLGPAVPISNLSATNDSPTDLGQTTTFTATVSAGSGVSYAWDFGDQTTDSGQVVTHVYAATGTYTGVVTATNSLGNATATTVVTITDVPVAGLTAVNNSPTPLGNMTSLTAAVASGSNVSYQWDLGNDVVKQGQSVTFTYAAAGFYTAVVTASNSVSLVVATTPVTIFNPKHLYLPLIFKTP